MLIKTETLQFPAIFFNLESIKKKDDLKKFSRKHLLFKTNLKNLWKEIKLHNINNFLYETSLNRFKWYTMCTCDELLHWKQFQAKNTKINFFCFPQSFIKWCLRESIFKSLKILHRYFVIL